MPKELTAEALAEYEVRWESIQATRPRDPTTHEPEAGTPGKAFMRWHNGMIDRILVLRRDRQWKMHVQRVHGGQTQTIEMDAIRTLEEILRELGERWPDHYPKGKTPEQLRDEWNPALLPLSITDAIWGVNSA